MSLVHLILLEIFNEIISILKRRVFENGKMCNKIYFIYNSIKLNFSDETPIKKIFSCNKTPYIKALEAN